MSLYTDTLIPYVDKDGNEQIGTIKLLVDTYQAIDDPIRVLSYTPLKIIQQANAVNIQIGAYATSAVVIKFVDGSSVMCSEDHPWAIFEAAQIGIVNSQVTTDVHLFNFLAAEFLEVGDKLFSTNVAGFQEIALITSVSLLYVSYYTMVVPMFGNYLVEVRAPNGNASRLLAASQLNANLKQQS